MLTLPKDPRYFQITALSGLLLYGNTILQFGVLLHIILLILGTVLAMQYVCSRIVSTGFDYRSALISGLSLCLLVRSDEWIWLVMAAAISIASKFLIRRKGKHIFNPTNIGIVIMLLFSVAIPSIHIWVSPGQWGSIVWLAFLMVCLGGLVVYRSARSDVALAFLISYSALIYGRALWLGDPLAIPTHQLQQGAILLFAFFMISDPKTTPDSRFGRLIFSFLTALFAYGFQFCLYLPHGLFYALPIGALFVPWIDKYWPGSRYDWNQRG